jgi:hypothetical protein
MTFNLRWGVCVLVACTACGGGSEPSAGSWSVAANSTTAFDATYRLADAWARAKVAYTPSTTFFELTTSTGAVIVRTGTALSGKDVAVAPEDPRRIDEVIRLAPSDADYALVSGLLDALIAAGASAHPTALEAGSTSYAAAYFAAKALGKVATRSQAEGAILPDSWPHPGYINKEDVPPELRVKVAGEQNGQGSTTCCGPYECYHCEWNPGTSCDDWCAAGDFCNHWGWGNCGTAFYWPSGGCNSCPHSDSSTIMSNDVQGCNNGSCSIACNDTYGAWDDTFYGPASNFCNYGSYYWGYQCGGEYGNYYGNCGY